MIKFILQSMQQMGNSKARAVYEANLPDGYRRPAQNDQAMEAFIRQKYEKRKYIAAEWSSPATPEFPVGWDEAATAAHLIGPLQPRSRAEAELLALLGNGILEMKMF